MSEMGPYAIIYPRDNYHELKTLEVNAKPFGRLKPSRVCNEKNLSVCRYPCTCFYSNDIQYD